MASIDRKLDLGDYIYEIKLVSKSTFAHAMLAKHVRDEIEIELDKFIKFIKEKVKEDIMKRNNRQLPLVLLLSLFTLYTTTTYAQTVTPTIEYDYLNDTIANVNTYTQVITLNGTVLANPTCAQAGANVTCSVPAPGALTTGDNTVKVTATKNGVVAETTMTGLKIGTGPKSPTGPRYKVVIVINLP